MVMMAREMEIRAEGRAEGREESREEARREDAERIAREFGVTVEKAMEILTKKE